MKILITHVYSSDNKGDAAILSVLLSELRRVFNRPSLVISSMDPPGHKQYDNTKIASSFIFLDIIQHKDLMAKLAASIWTIISTTAVAYAERHRIAASWLLNKQDRAVYLEYAEADLIVCIGGGYIRSSGHFSDNLNIVMLLHPLLLAIILRKRIYLHSQSFGPFTNSFQRILVRWVLSKIKLIEVREDVSYAALRTLGIPATSLVRTIDAGFLSTSSSKRGNERKLHHSKDSLRIGITVRQWFRSTAQSNFEAEIGKFIDAITTENDFEVVFIPQVTSAVLHDDDRLVAKRIAKRLKNPNRVNILTMNYDYNEIKSLYANLDLMIGTRFHSVIFALTSYVPSIAIEYEHKTRGIMEDIGLGKWVIPIESVRAEELYKMFMELKSEQAVYTRHLVEILPGYLSKAREAAELIRDAYNRDTAASK